MASDYTGLFCVLWGRFFQGFSGVVGFVWMTGMAMHVGRAAGWFAKAERHRRFRLVLTLRIILLRFQRSRYQKDNNIAEQAALDC